MCDQSAPLRKSSLIKRFTVSHASGHDKLVRLHLLVMLQMGKANSNVTTSSLRSILRDPFAPFEVLSIPPLSAAPLYRRRYIQPFHCIVHIDFCVCAVSCTRGCNYCIGCPNYPNRLPACTGPVAAHRIWGFALKRQCIKFCFRFGSARCLTREGRNKYVVRALTKYMCVSALVHFFFLVVARLCPCALGAAPLHFCSGEVVSLPLL